MNLISLAQAFENWKELAADLPKDDEPMRAESWNDYTDSLAKDGELCALQYQYAPACDEPMPGEGSRFDPLADDREFILDAMGVTLTAVFVPWSRSRNAKEESPSLNWRVTLKRNGRNVIETDYMQGCGHCPAYNAPTLRENGTRDEYTTRKRIKSECETGRTTSRGDWRTSTFRADLSRIDPPSVADIVQSLLSDADTIDAGGFAEWCADLGYSDDNTSARATYDACIDIAVKLRGAFGEKTLAELRELFADM